MPFIKETFKMEPTSLRRDTGTECPHNFLSFTSKSRRKRELSTFVCELCFASFRQSSTTNQRVCPKDHSKVFNFEPQINGYPSQQQNSIFSDLKMKQRIQLGSKAKRGLFKCLCCSYESFYWPDIERHVSDYHALHLPFSCHLCPFTAASLHYLDVHIMTHTEGILGQCKNLSFLRELRAKRKFELEAGILEKSHFSTRRAEPTQLRSSSDKIVTSGHDTPFNKVKSSVIVTVREMDPCQKESQVNSESAEGVGTEKSYSCPFCNFLTRDQRSFASHFNSHSLVLL